MIQKKPPSKKKTIVSFAIVIVMLTGMAWILFGQSSSTDTFIPAEPGSSMSLIPANTRLDNNLFQNPLFGSLMPQSGVLPVDPARIGRANPFVPVGAKKLPQ